MNLNVVVRQHTPVPAQAFEISSTAIEYERVSKPEPPISCGTFIDIKPRSPAESCSSALRKHPEISESGLVANGYFDGTKVFHLIVWWCRWGTSSLRHFLPPRVELPHLQTFYKCLAASCALPRVHWKSFVPDVSFLAERAFWATCCSLETVDSGWFILKTGVENRLRRFFAEHSML